MPTPNRANFAQPVVLLDPATGLPVATPFNVVTANITGKFREAFEVYTPGTRWDEVKANGDLVYVDGNAAAASYLVISKSPLNTGTETTITCQETTKMPVEVALGMSMSQRTLGQEFASELIDTGPPLVDMPDLEISIISQASSVLTVDTTTPHGLSIGKSVGIARCVNPLANYPALVVATVPSPTQFTCTAGPNGTIASQTIANPTGVKGVVFFRERLGRAEDGTSMIFEQTTVTQASLYSRSEAGDAYPSGAIAGNHSLTVGTSAPIQLVASAYTYAFAPVTEYKLTQQSDRMQWSDGAIDAIAGTTQRLTRTSVIPSPDKVYKLRFRATNNDSLTVPVAQIVSAVKSGTTTATINTDREHTLAVGDPIVLYGVRDQAATAFPNLVTTVAVASIISPTSFTVIIGTAATVTSYGGYVARVNGGNLMSALGAVGQVAQAAVLSTLSDGTRQLVLTGSASWTAPAIIQGDTLELVGCRNSVDGATLGIDGAWKVATVSSAVLTLVLPYAGSMVLPDNFGSTNCGGALIKRTELRLSYVRIFDYERERVELLTRPTNDVQGSVPVQVTGGGIAITSGTVTTVSTVTQIVAAGTPSAPATPFFVSSLATTNGALILTGTSGVQACYATNAGAAAAYVKLYNKATAPTVGTDVPEMIIPIPAAVAGVPGVAELSPGFNAYRFALGLGIAITGGAADTDTTAVAAGQVKVKLSRTI